MVGFVLLPVLAKNTNEMEAFDWANNCNRMDHTVGRALRAREPISFLVNHFVSSGHLGHLKVVLEKESLHSF